MGSRISIHLTDLLGQPQIRVEVFAEDEPVHDGERTVSLGTVQYARVEFGTDVFVFDAHTHEGRVFLELDFNFFRRPNSSGERLMRQLYEFSVPFKVNH